MGFDRLFYEIFGRKVRGWDVIKWVWIDEMGLDELGWDLMRRDDGEKR